MPLISIHRDLLNQYLISMLMQEVFWPADQQSLEVIWEQNGLDVSALLSILLTHYPNGWTTVPKSGNMHLAWDFMQDPAHHNRYTNMLQVSPLVFDTILTLIKEHPVFTNSFNNSQTPVEQQLAVMLFRLGRYGNGASVEDIACQAECSEGSVERYTDQCFEVIELLHDLFVRKLTSAEKEVEKQWMDEHLGFQGKW